MRSSRLKLWGFFYVIKNGGLFMPFKFKKPCAYQGCPKLTKEVYCDEHKHLNAKQYDSYKRDPEHDKKYGSKWRKTRSLYVRHYPLCEMCLKVGKFVPVEEVHHIVPLSQGGSNDFSNLMSLCQSCHTKLHYELGDRK